MELTNEAPLHAVESDLALLAGATSREILQAVVADAFACRHQGWTRDRRRRLVQELSLPDDAAAQSLFQALRHLLRVAVELADVSIAPAERPPLLEAAFSDAFPRKLRLRVVTAVVAALPGWRDAAVQSEVGQPRLLEVHSGVTVQAAGSVSGAGHAGVGEATAWLRLRVEGAVTHAGRVAQPREVHMTVDRHALAAAVASASTLRARLSAIAEQTAAT